MTAVRRRRGAAESLGAIVLGFESVVVFLAGLAAFGLKSVPPGIAPWWAVVVGAVMAVLMIAVGGLLRHRWGIALGWLLQVIVALGGFLLPALFIVAAIFGGMWGYATIEGAALDRRNAAALRTESNGD